MIWVRSWCLLAPEFSFVGLPGLILVCFVVGLWLRRWLSCCSGCEALRWVGEFGGFGDFLWFGVIDLFGLGLGLVVWRVGCSIGGCVFRDGFVIFLGLDYCGSGYDSGFFGFFVCRLYCDCGLSRFVGFRG